MDKEKEELLRSSLAVVALLKKKDVGFIMAKNICEAMELADKIEVPPEFLSENKEESVKPVVSSYATEKKLISSIQESGVLPVDSSSFPLELSCFHEKDKESAKISYGIKIDHKELPESILLYCREEIGSLPKAAMYAMRLALEVASKYLSSFKEIKISIPSDYVFNAITDWAYRWEKNNWRKSNGSIKNLDLVQDCFNSYKEIKHKVAIASTEEDHAHRDIESSLFLPLRESGFQYAKSTAIISEKKKKD